MQFRKISDTKIHCVISQEEMWEKGIEIDDFLDHREKTEEFLREILAEAKYELDLKDMGHFFSVQMSVMPEGGVSLVITGENTSQMEGALAEFGKRLQDFKEIMSEAKKQVEQQEAKKDTVQPKEAKDSRKIPVWVKIQSLDQCIEMAKQLHKKEDLQSSLYKYQEEYFMQITFGQEQSEIAGTILIASEFAEDIFTQEQGGALLLEHGKVLIKKDAIQQLAVL